MSMFTLAVSCLMTSYLPWFMDLTFQIPMQYCSLQHWTLLPSPVTSTTGCCFCFGSVSSFFLELFLHWSPVAYWAPTHLGSSSFVSYLFCLFILFMKVPHRHCWTQCPWPCNMPLLTDPSTGDSWTLMDTQWTLKSGSVSCVIIVPFSWVLVHTRFCLCPPRVCFPSPV